MPSNLYEEGVMIAFRLKEKERGRKQSDALCTANPLGVTLLLDPCHFYFGLESVSSPVRGADGASVRAYGAVCRTERYDDAAEVDLTNNRNDSRI